MTEKTAKDILVELHHGIAKHMLKKLQAGDVEAKDLAVMVKYLKDNNIELDTLNGTSGDDIFNGLVEAAQKSIEAHKH